MNKDLIEILKNPNDKLIAVDLDGTLSVGVGIKTMNQNQYKK